MKRLFCLLLLLITAVPFTAFAQDDAETPRYEMYRTEDGTFVTLLPEDWVATGNNIDGLIVGNSPAALYMMSNESETFTPPQPGEFGLGIAALHRDLLAILDVPADASYTDMLDIFIGLMMDDPSFPSIEEQGELTGDEFDFAGAYATGSNAIMDLKLVVFDLSVDTIGLVLMAAAAGEMADFEIEAAQVLVTTSYAPPLEETYTNEDATLSFGYPSGWEAKVDESGLVYVTNAPEVALDAQMEPGQFIISVLDLTALGLAGSTLEESAEALLPLILDEGDVADDPAILVMGENEILVIGVDNEDTTQNDGGLILHEHNGSIYAVAYVSAYDEASLVGYIGAAILLSIGD